MTLIVLYRIKVEGQHRGSPMVESGVPWGSEARPELSSPLYQSLQSSQTIDHSEGARGRGSEGARERGIERGNEGARRRWEVGEAGRR